MTEETVPRSTVVQLAKQVRELQHLHARKAGTMADLIRASLAAMQQTTGEARRRLERERRNLPIAKQRIGFTEPAAKVTKDKKLAILHLEWLATQLENQSDRDPVIIDQEKTPCTEA